MTSKVMDVIVVGCGASGIAALRKLHDAGLKAVGLEAADRIGGRICTVEFGAASVDIGAAWCEGDDNNAVFDLANPLDLLEPELPAAKWFVSSNGELVPAELASDVVNGFDAAINSADKMGTKSISECVSTSVTNIETLKKNPNLAKPFVEWYERNNHVGGQNDPKEGKSLRGIEECFVDRNVMLNWKGRGYKTVLDILLNKYPDPSKELPIKILLNKEVVSIKWRTNQPGRETDIPLVHVKCEDGSLFAAKSVIVAVSIGVLKRQCAQLFNPPLPTEKVNTINNLQLCVLGKIYIEFTEAWWPKTPANFAILWRDEDKAKFTDKERWITEIYGLDTVAHQPNVLLTWIYGNGALQMEKASEQEVKDGVIKLLDLVLKKQFNITPVKSILRTQWGSDPLTGGAYAYRSVALEEKGGSAAILGEPLYHGNGFPVVCFAGEATSYHNHGAVHGAVEAGYREADRLIESFKEFSF